MHFTWIAVTHSTTLLILLVFLLGFIAKQLNLPPLVGFLIAGFVMKMLGIEMPDSLHTISDLGITLLLFTIGLKLDLKTLTRPHIWAVSTVHVLMVIASFSVLMLLLSYFAIPLIGDLDLKTSILLAFALSFSSTVFAVKVLEEKGELKSNHGRIAIGILIMQDIFAVGFLTVASGSLPSPWAIAVILALVAVRPLLIKLMECVGHGELLVIAGFIFALGGASLFEMVSMKADLGALIMGILLAKQSRSSEMASSLLAFKDLFLIGFFLSIGLTASINVEVVLVAFILVLMMPIKVLMYYWLLSMFRLRARTSFLSSLSLANYSEFGLIVGAIGYKYGWLSNDWLGAIAVAMGLTFIVASPLNIKSHRLYQRLDKVMTRFQRQQRLSDENLISTGKAEILVFGMGRVGTATYETMRKNYGDIVLGIDNDAVVIEAHKKRKRKVILGDATDSEFWEKLHIKNISLILLDMPRPEENLFAFSQLADLGFKGKIAATAKYDDQVEMLKAAGLHAAYNIYGEAGAGFANHVTEQLCSEIEFTKASES